MSEWQDIATAPRDGTPVLLFGRAKTATAKVRLVGWMIDGEWIEACFAPNRPVTLADVSEWMPLPAPPTR